MRPPGCGRESGSGRLCRACAAIVIALLLTSAVVALTRAHRDELAHAALAPFVLPVALCAVTFGLRGGLLSAAAATMLSGAWFASGDHPIAGIDGTGDVFRAGLGAVA